MLEWVPLFILAWIFHMVSKARGAGPYGTGGAIACGFMHLGALIVLAMGVFDSKSSFLGMLFYSFVLWLLGIFLRAVDDRDTW